MSKHGKVRVVQGTPCNFLTTQIIGNHMKKITKWVRHLLCAWWIKGDRKVKSCYFTREEVWTSIEIMDYCRRITILHKQGFTHVTWKGQFVYETHVELCLKTQRFLNVVNHPNFALHIVTKENPYEHSMLFKFSTK